MLDFYLIKDKQPKPEYPEQLELEFAGGVDFEVFKDLIRKGAIDSHFYFYSDFRWTREMTKLIFERLKNKTTNEQIELILIKAIKSNSGVIAYCD